MTEFGETKVLCTASVQDSVPGWLRGQGRGWITAEYSMLPGSSKERVRREAAAGRQKGRTMEIQRLIGRALRAVCDFEVMGEQLVTVDCDVLQADGGTRTASISGSFLALNDAFERLILDRKLKANPLAQGVAAVSVAVVGGQALLDPNYEEDFRADVDMNIVMNGSGQFLEIQGTAEEAAFSKSELDALLVLAEKGIAGISKAQKDYLSILPPRQN